VMSVELPASLRWTPPSMTVCPRRASCSTGWRPLNRRSVGRCWIALAWAQGLPSIREVEERRRVESANVAARSRASKSSGWQLCHEPSCSAIPINSLGVPIASSVVRWWCPAHEHLAAPGDLEPHGSGVRLSESGALVPVDEGDEARDAAAAESRRAQLADRAAEREVEAAEAAEHRRLREDAFRGELPPGVPG
jgi:hypothetical protein